MDCPTRCSTWNCWQLQCLIILCVKLEQKTGHLIREITELIVPSQAPTSIASSSQVHVEGIESALD